MSGLLRCALHLLFFAVAFPVSADYLDAPPAFAIERSAVHTLVVPDSRRSYDLYVKLPPGYDKPENLLRRYPVIWLNDGPYTFQVASGVSRVPFSQELFEEFILVGVSYAQGDMPADSRRRDLTPTADAKKPGSGGARAYLAFLRDTALPFVERRYRADPARRTLAGQSYGALFGLWVAFSEPELFQNYILTSTSLWYDRRAMFALEGDYAAKHKDLPAQLFFAVGEREKPGQCGHRECDVDMVADQAAMVQRLRSRAYTHLRVQARVVPEAYHETTFPVGLLWAMQQLFMPRR